MHRDPAPRTDLPQAGDAGPNVITGVLPLRVPAHDERQLRRGPTGSSHPSGRSPVAATRPVPFGPAFDRSWCAGFVLGLVGLSAVGEPGAEFSQIASIRLHGPELQHREWLTVEPFAAGDTRCPAERGPRLMIAITPISGTAKGSDAQARSRQAIACRLCGRSTARSIAHEPPRAGCLTAKDQLESRWNDNELAARLVLDRHPVRALEHRYAHYWCTTRSVRNNKPTATTSAPMSARHSWREMKTNRAHDSLALELAHPLPVPADRITLARPTAMVRQMSGGGHHGARAGRAAGLAGVSSAAAPPSLTTLDFSQQCSCNRRSVWRSSLRTAACCS